ncbi:hypothetical protein HOC13_02580 [Candidatus Woesearchaeota archaeon]|jgi:DNA primase catalytic subunit|nr:hypothetical protein [Candidatus Woesearchaeota archaeon]
MDIGVQLRYYKKKEIQEAIVEHAQDKEIAIRYGASFGKRPDMLLYPMEILELAKRGATSFHCSEEIWENPLQLGGLNRKEMDELREGWDLILDIDCKIMEYSRICADLVIRFLKYCGVKDICCKFSGNKGFHIGVPFEAFPQKVGDTLTRMLFPEAPKKIALYIKENIEDELGKRILEFEGNDFSKVVENVGLEKEEVIRYEPNKFGDQVAKLHVDKFLEIDTVLMSSRHLYRMPYSLHEKSGLVSLPIDPDKVLEFEKRMAQPDKVLAVSKYMNRNITGESGRRLLVQALDYEVKVEPDRDQLVRKEGFEEIKIESPITEEFFPPCIKKILLGMEDGKKRAVFALANFLGKLGWDFEGIKEFLLRWNKEKNREPLRDAYILGQLAHFKPGEKLPPNCGNDAYYKGIGVCDPGGLCKKIKNPVNYTIIRWRMHLRENEGKKEAEENKKEEKIKK